VLEKRRAWRREGAGEGKRLEKSSGQRTSSAREEKGPEKSRGQRSSVSRPDSAQAPGIFLLVEQKRSGCSTLEQLEYLE
jgi:hypothetical protein